VAAELHGSAAASCPSVLSFPGLLSGTGRPCPPGRSHTSPRRHSLVQRFLLEIGGYVWDIIVFSQFMH
jgi:hypothetical protein